MSALVVACSLGLGVPTVSAEDKGTDASSAEQHDIGLMPGVPLAPYDVDPSHKVGVIDSGVRKDHPQIGNSVGAMRDFTGEGLGDSFGHGTKVILSLLHAVYEPSQNTAKRNPHPHPRLPFEIEVAKVIGKKRASPREVADRIADAIVWLALLDVRMVNISLSLPDGEADYTRLCATIAAQHDMSFYIAAGNSGQETVLYPASCSAEKRPWLAW